MTALARIALAAALLCAAACATPAAAAAPMTGGELYNNCSSENAVDRTECLAFLGGVWTGAMIYGSRAKGLLCPTGGGMNAGQLALIFIKWARDNPQYLDRDRGHAAAASLNKAYPCK